MPFTPKEVIDEADKLVPNGYVPADKIPWLNAINNEFFDVVKIPKVELFASVAGQTEYTFTGIIKEKNIDKILVGHLKYLSASYADVQPGQNWFIFTDLTKRLTLNAAPSRSGITGTLRYYESPVTVYTLAKIATDPIDAPNEYHWIYSLGLAGYIAKANEEDAKAANYGGQYRNALQVAAQNYQKEGAT